ncbi:MAG: RNA-binding S4 domain-containing protein [Oscillospiraceae bacterium]|nr:RNA-binding S4 domain-containing protein [Oscillospiraceae bacterium]
MRIDKYLKVSRIIKRRTVANDACDAGRVQINGKVAKPGSEVREGDKLEIRFGSRVGLYEVVSIQEHALKADAASMYRVISEPDGGQGKALDP